MIIPMRCFTCGKELANKKTKFECKILNVKKPKANKIDDEFAKLMGAKDIKDLPKCTTFILKYR